ncbi:MAG: hypothetical protein H6855_04735 [Rhodospirillales bacterium]|nr:hypothetical protein [Rhodospirillales bacterium]MCB9973264.1 hypothetical protein [Rhodospirillales bacterium]MCB9980586.1 hypothetical protein [Rhodospirillales bacterium]
MTTYYKTTQIEETSGTSTTSVKYSHLERLLGETEEAYNNYLQNDGHMNGDFADFALQSINCFQRALRNPYLTKEDLAWALRKCDRLKPAAEQAGVPWTILAAACLSGRNNLFSANQH